MNSFNFLGQLSKSGIRIPIIAYCPSHLANRNIDELLAYLRSQKIECLKFNASCQIEMNNQLKSLGEEISHVVVDATKGIHLKGLLGLIGKLKSGSLFFLLLADKENALTTHDSSSSAWYNFSYTQNNSVITAPLFNHFLYACINSITHCAIPSTLDFNWHDLPELIKITFKTYLIPNKQNHDFHPDDFLTEEQNHAYKAISHSNYKINLLSAKRGRGKTYTLNFLINDFFNKKTSFILTGARKKLYSNKLVPIDDHFLAPDALDLSIDKFQSKHKNNSTIDYFMADWLIIDEAATISMGTIKKWVSFFKKILLVSTLDGYEGSGQSLNLKLQSLDVTINHIKLNQPIRFTESCPLNQLSECLMVTHCSQLITSILNARKELLMLNTESLTIENCEKRVKTNLTLEQKKFSFYSITKLSLESINIANCLYLFFKNIHYQTTPNDFRRLLDGQNQQIYLVTADLNNENLNSYDPLRSIPYKQSDNDLEKLPIKAAAWLLFEGGANIELAKKIWTGERRPKANLVAQSLATHGSNPRFPTLKGIRISRIGVTPSLRRHKLATGIVQQIINKAKKANDDKVSKHNKDLSVDYISVSFGYEKELLIFWTKLGFQLVHISHSADASSGQKSIMMIYPISKNGIIETRQSYTYFTHTMSLLENFCSKTPNIKNFTHPLEIFFLYLKESPLEELNYVSGENVVYWSDELSASNPSLTTNCQNRIDNISIYCLCAFTFHFKSFSSTIPTFYYLNNTMNNLPEAFNATWANYINLGLFPKKQEIQNLRKQFTDFLNTYFPDKVINYNDWLSDTTSFIINDK